MGVNNFPNERVGGFVRRLGDGLKRTLSAPIWFGGIALERTPGDWAKVQRRQTYNDVRAEIVGISYGPSYNNFEYGQFPTTFTATPDTTDFKYITAVQEGVMVMLTDSDFATAYYAGELVKVQSDAQTIEGQSLTLPCIVPVSTFFGGGGWTTNGTLADTGTVTGSILRQMMGVLDDVVGHVDENVGSAPGDNNWANVVLMLRDPQFHVPSA